MSEPRTEAVRIALRIHDEAVMTNRRAGFVLLLPEVNAMPEAFIAALEAQDPPFTVVALAAETPREGLDELRALSNAATPGPWERVTEGSHDQKGAAAKAFLAVMATVVPDNPDIQFSDLTFIRAGFPNVAMVGNGPRQTENGDFIVAAANYVRSTLAALRSTPETEEEAE